MNIIVFLIAELCRAFAIAFMFYSFSVNLQTWKEVGLPLLSFWQFFMVAVLIVCCFPYKYNNPKAKP